ncbi:MAG: hypothetical protein ACRC8Y_21595 [Chroococcales cyanobacterium]
MLSCKNAKHSMWIRTATEINPLVSSANQFSKKFQKQFHLPLVLGLNDERHQKIRQIATALES